MRSGRWATMVCVLGCALAFAPHARAGQGIAVVNEGGIKDKWMLAEGVPLAVPQYPTQFARRHDTVCIGLGYLLNPDGTTSDFALVKAWSSAGTNEPEEGYWGSFAESAANALRQWRFKPRPEVAQAQPVYTIATFVFGGAGAANGYRGRCAVPKLAARLRELRASKDSRTTILDRLDLEDVAATNAADTRRPMN